MVGAPWTYYLLPLLHVHSDEPHIYSAVCSASMGCAPQHFHVNFSILTGVRPAVCAVVLTPDGVD